MIRTRSPERASCGTLALAVALGAAFTASDLVRPAPASAQEEMQEQVQQQVGGTHEVVTGNTLWDLAARFYGDPYQWPVIYEANEDRIVDPHWIYPGQILTIPGLEGQPDQEVMVVPGEPERLRGSGVGDRTVFYNPVAGGDEGIGIVGLPPTERFALSPDIFYSAPWMKPEGRAPSAIGRVLGFTGAEQVRSNLQTARPFDRLRVQIDGGPMLQVGMLLQTFRVARDIPETGTVMVPTGILTVAQVEEAGIVGVVSQEFDRLRVGDFVRIAPRYPLELGVHAAETMDAGPTPEVLAFGEVHEIYNLGDVALLDMGRVDGIAVGDEFVAIADHGEGWSGEVEGRVQVIAVQDRHASARIVELRNPVFREGIVLHPFRKMP